MIIKRYLVKDMNEAMAKIRYELGKDAIIVSNRWIRQRGITNFFKRKVLEVTAAVDRKARGAPPKGVQGNGRSKGRGGSI